jgi:hypothetical protein
LAILFKRVLLFVWAVWFSVVFLSTHLRLFVAHLVTLMAIELLPEAVNDTSKGNRCLP